MDQSLRVSIKQKSWNVSLVGSTCSPGKAQTAPTTNSCMKAKQKTKMQHHEKGWNANNLLGEKYLQLMWPLRVSITNLQLLPLSL